MNGGAAMGGGGDAGAGTGPNVPGAGPNTTAAEDKSVTVEYPNNTGMIDLDSGSVVLARRPAFAEEAAPSDYPDSDEPEVSA